MITAALAGYTCIQASDWYPGQRLEQHLGMVSAQGLGDAHVSL
jgi:hypothetical protein